MKDCSLITSLSHKGSIKALGVTMRDLSMDGSTV